MWESNTSNTDTFFYFFISPHLTCVQVEMKCCHLYLVELWSSCCSPESQLHTVNKPSTQEETEGRVSFFKRKLAPLRQISDPRLVRIRTVESTWTLRFDMWEM